MSSQSDFVTYNLTKEELELAIAIGKARNDNKKGAVNLKIKKEYGDDMIHIMGVKGELGMARLLGLDIDREIIVDKGDNGTDLMFANGLSVQVKAVSNPTWDFKLNGSRKKSLMFDVACLCHVSKEQNDRNVTFMGWTTLVHFLSNYECANFGSGDVLMVTTKKLLPPKSLISIREKMNTPI